MALITEIIKLVHTETVEPRAFGILHLSFIFAVLCVTVFFCVKLCDVSDATFRRVIGGAFFVMLTLEILKQVLSSMSVSDGEIVYSYVWSAFPFQLCSTPIYILPILAFAPDGKLRDCVASYTMTFALAGGLVTYIFPKTILTGRMIINVQTLIHHGLQIITGVYTAAYYRRKIDRRFFLGGVSVFAVVFAIANFLNTVGYKLFVSFGIMADGEAFNMFYISPRADQTVPILSDFFNWFHPIVFIAGYFVVLTLSAALLTYIARTVYTLAQKRE